MPRHIQKHTSNDARPRSSGPSTGIVVHYFSRRLRMSGALSCKAAREPEGQGRLWSQSSGSPIVSVVQTSDPAKRNDPALAS